jgi:hypothetical protein
MVNNNLRLAALAALNDAASRFGDSHHWTRFFLPDVQTYLTHLEELCLNAGIGVSTEVEDAAINPTALAQLVDTDGQPVEVPAGDVSAEPQTVDKGKRGK